MANNKEAMRIAIAKYQEDIKIAPGEPPDLRALRSLRRVYGDALISRSKSYAAVHTFAGTEVKLPQ
jgi:hypothetical protein